MELEKTAQKLANESETFFQVTLDDRDHTVARGTDGLSYDTSVRCPSGSVRLEMFCGRRSLSHRVQIQNVKCLAWNRLIN